VAEASRGLPLMLYLRDDHIGVDAIEKLCQVEGVVGVKWACPTPLALATAIRRCDPQVIWTVGLAETWAPPFYAVGARGFTSGLINVWPEHSVDIHAALEAGDYDHARNLIDIMAGFEELRTHEQNGTNVSVVKAALALLGKNCGAARPPSAWPLTLPDALTLREQLEAWGLMVEAPLAMAI
jgi:4-hydroxy-tetrahydrodipicolinate synthase